MKGDFVDVGAGALAQSEPHDEFLELCAISTSGELTQEEQAKLDRHLAACPDCRRAIREYQAIADDAIPSIAASEDHASVDPGPRWSLKQAEKRFLDRLGNQPEQPPERTAGRNAAGRDGFGFHPLPPPTESAWNRMWALYAAGILLFVSLSVFTYRVGLHRGSRVPTLSRVANVGPPAIVPAIAADQTAIEAQLSDAGHDRAIARAQIVQRDRTIADLKHQLARQSAEIDELRTVEAQLQTRLQSDDENRAELEKRQAELSQKLAAAEGNSQSVQQKLETLAQQSTKDAARAKASDAKVNELTKLLEDREAALEQQDQMLAHDRDIRELMGARDLYISEVYAVGDQGETKKPYGRVFYTRGKSLIFYAYDLDQQNQLKHATTFQAWGRRGPDPQHAINLGIFYEDNSSKKRWIMKCEDPRTLAQIDGVFVTVEPNGGSRKPSDRRLLWSYLKLNANHP